MRPTAGTSGGAEQATSPRALDASSSARIGPSGSPGGTTARAPSGATGPPSKIASGAVRGGVAREKVARLHGTSGYVTRGRRVPPSTSSRRAASGVHAGGATYVHHVAPAVYEVMVTSSSPARSASPATKSAARSIPSET